MKWGAIGSRVKSFSNSKVDQISVVKSTYDILERGFTVSAPVVSNRCKICSLNKGYSPFEFSTGLPIRINK